MTATRRFDRRLFSLLLVAGLVGVAAALPMLIDLLATLVPEDRRQQLAVRLPLPAALVVLVAFAQSAILLGGATAGGMVLVRQVGTGAPIIEGALNGELPPGWWRTLLRALAIGLTLGIALVLVDVAVLLPRVPSVLVRVGQSIAAWKRLLAGVLYGGITEELLMRWFLLSLVVWAIGRAWRAGDGRPTAGAWWAANVVVAALFAAAHLPITSALVPLTNEVVARSFILNGAASLTFGWLFWRRGLEGAMVAHAGCHVGLQLLGPAVARAMSG